jgi:microtubule-associated protein, RP/EB family
MDSLYPGTFQFSKVRWGAKHEYEFVDNYKVLQAAFDKNGIKRHVDTAKLVKARPLDNLEFCQWIKAYFDKNYNGEPYDALARRKNQDLYYILGGGKVGAGPSCGVPASTKTSAAPVKRAPAAGAAASGSGIGAGRGIGGGAAASGAEVKKLQEQVQELKLQTDTLDKERDFYFSKLRDIELLLQARQLEAGPGNDLSQDILKILYAAEDEKVEVTQAGELTITAPNGDTVTGATEPAGAGAAAAEEGDADME